MTLATIIINDEVRHQTDLLLTKASYQTLRQYLLERQSIPSINDAIDSLLLEEFKKDKQTLTKELKEEAYAQQYANDQEEAKLDTLEHKHDQLLKTNLSKILPDLEQNYANAEVQHRQQEYKTNQISNEISDLRARITTIENSINQVQANRRLVITQIPYTYTPIWGHHHHHHHHRCHQVPTMMYNGYPFYQQASWANSINEENNLNAERNRLSSMLSTKTSEYSSERQILDNLSNTRNSIRQQIQTIKSQLTDELPNKEHQREIREQERAARTQARISDNNSPQQLSSHSSEELNKKIATKIMELNSVYKLLKHHSRMAGYSIFLDQFSKMLETSQNKLITFSERSALKTIHTKINQYNEIAKNHDKTISALNREQVRLKILQTTEMNINEQIKQAEQIHKNASAIKNQVNSDKNTLNQSMGRASTIKTSMLFTSLFGASSAGLSLGLIIVFTANPLFFIIPASLALLTVVALGIAAGYHWYHSKTTSKLLERANELSKKNETSLAETHQIHTDLTQTELPAVLETKSHTEEKLNQLLAQSQQEQKEMETLFKKIENISPAMPGTSSLFNLSPKAAEQGEELEKYLQPQTT